MAVKSYSQTVPQQAPKGPPYKGPNPDTQGPTNTNPSSAPKGPPDTKPNPDTSGPTKTNPNQPIRPGASTRVKAGRFGRRAPKTGPGNTGSITPSELRKLADRRLRLS